MTHPRLLNLLAALLAFGLLVLPVARYLGLQSGVADLGIFSNHLFNFGSGPDQHFWIGYGHFQPFTPLYSWFYRLTLSPALLVLTQAAVILSAILFLPVDDPEHRPLYRVLFLLSYGVWNLAVFDFHFDHLVIPLSMGFYWMLHRRRFPEAFWFGVLVAMVKEPFAAVTAAMGLYWILKYRSWRWGLPLMAFGIVYFVVSLRLVIPFFSPGYAEALRSNPAQHFGGDLGERILYPVLHPLDFTRDIFLTRRFVYLNAAFSAFGYLVVLFSPLELLPAVPLLAIALLSQFESYHSYRYHYGAGLVVPFLVAFIYGWPRFLDFFEKRSTERLGFWPKRRHLTTFILVVALLSHFFFALSPFSRFFWFRIIPQAHWTAFVPRDRDARIVAALRRFVPNDPRVSVSVQDTLNHAWLSNRRYQFLFPDAVLKPAYRPIVSPGGILSLWADLLLRDPRRLRLEPVWADYVIWDLKRPLYLLDRNATREDYACYEKRMLKDFDLVHEDDGFRIYRRKRSR